jgi:hypothetical protein
MCQHAGCSAALKPRATPGRPPRFCEAHQGGRFSVARSRAQRKAQPPRPPCCIDAGRLGGRTSCPQHKDAGLGRIGAGASFADYAGAFPKPKHVNSPELPPPGTWHVDDGRPLYGEWMTETYSSGALAGSFIRVIGSGREDAEAWLAAHSGWDK